MRNRDPVEWYEKNSSIAAADYESADPSQLNRWLSDLLPRASGTIIDIGAGSGRDAAWFAALGHDVLAIEPSAAMRIEGMRRHPMPSIRWIDDRLPEMSVVSRVGASADVVFLSGVWQHIPASSRERAFRKLADLVRSGGLLVLTLRHGPASAERAMHDVSADEVERLARGRGFVIAKIESVEDSLGRRDVKWTRIALRLPDDGTGAFPILRHIILNDDKSSTYKLALLRSICRIADGSAGLAVERADGDFDLPLGLVALNWVRQYLPLVSHRLPQSPRNEGPDSLGFVRDGFRALLSRRLSPFDLRIGSRFEGETAKSIHAALRDAASTIDKMPTTFITWPAGGRIFNVERRRTGSSDSVIKLLPTYLASFGTLRVPGAIWLSLRRHGSWVEPALIAEWVRLMEGYSATRERPIDPGRAEFQLRWPDPDRDTAFAKQQAKRLLDAGPLRCVWTGRALDEDKLEIDHLFPIARWPCSDLWNLVPAHPDANRRKRDQVPSATLLLSASPDISDWWQSAYLSGAIPSAERFFVEAESSLPALSGRTLGAVLDAVGLQRVRLHRDQQVPEWNLKR
jgi:SAM-dependent methyltransferase